MTYSNVTETHNNGILTLTINRPDKLNALNRDTLSEIKSVIESATANPDVVGVIITGAGEKAFVAGADISEFLNISSEQGAELARAGQAIFNLIENNAKPIIAAVNGFALGGGCELAMACHMRLASENAKFGQPEVNLGLIPGYGGTQRLIQLIGKGKALELLMTADMIGAEEARQLGLVNHVTSQDDLLSACEKIISKIASKSPLAIAEVIQCANAYFEPNTDGFEFEVEHFGNCFGTPDFKEGTSAFIEKRKAEFNRDYALK